MSSAKQIQVTLDVVYISVTRFNIEEFNEILRIEVNKYKSSQGLKFYLDCSSVKEEQSFDDYIEFAVKAKKEIESHSSTLIQFEVASKVVRNLLLKSGIPAYCSGHEAHKTLKRSGQNIVQKTEGKTHIVKRNVHAGEVIQAENKNLIVIGNVSVGAELISDGSIFVLGALKGRAHAGIKTREQAVVYAQSFYPEQIKIMDEYLMDDYEEYNKKPVIAMLEPSRSGEYKLKLKLTEK